MQEIKIHTHGFVRLVDHMGDDASIAQAARTSYGKGTKTVNQDKGLIRYLIRHNHSTPVEMVQFKFHIKWPIFVARQGMRTRMASWNEYSGRYSEMEDEFFIPDLLDFTKQSLTNKQGGYELISEDKAVEARELFSKEVGQDFDNYTRNLNAFELSREIARINLPLSIYTQCYMSINLHNLFHFIKLRYDSHAQAQIQPYGKAMLDLITPIVPVAVEAFKDYKMNAVSLSALELKAVSSYIALLEKCAPELTTLEEYSKDLLEKRELSEFIAKFLNTCQR